MPCHISHDLKIAAMIRLHECQLLDLTNILECCTFYRRTWFCILKLWHKTGDMVSKSTSLHGQVRSIDFSDVRYLQYLINQNPNYFLNELLYLLKTNHFISVHYSTICCELSRAGISCKKLQKVANERNKELRMDFIWRMAQYAPDEIGFIDEVSRDERSVGRHYGWATRGN